MLRTDVQRLEPHTFATAGGADAVKEEWDVRGLEGRDHLRKGLVRCLHQTATLARRYDHDLVTRGAVGSVSQSSHSSRMLRRPCKCPCRSGGRSHSSRVS